MSWSSYAHLPNSKDEYREILSQLKNGMSVDEVDNIIATVKGKEKVTHHYRNNLARIGIFNINQKKIFLNYEADRLKEDREDNYLKMILSESVRRNRSWELNTVESVIHREKTYDIAVIAEYLTNEHPNIQKKNFIRWVRPIVNIFKIIDILPVTGHERILQEIYLKLMNQYGKLVALEELDNELKKIDKSYEIVAFINDLLNDINMKFKIELLMLPDWATQNKIYMINMEYYTHMKIKNSLLEGVSE